MPQRSFLKDILGVFGSNIFAIINGIFVGIIISRILGPEGRGIYVSILVVPVIVVSLSLLGIKRSTIYHIGKKTYKDNEIISGVFCILIITSPLGILISGIVYYFSRNPDFTFILIVLVLLTIPARMTIIYTEGVFLGKEQFYKSNRLKWMPGLINLLTLVFFIWIVRLSVFGALLSFLLSNLIVAIYSLCIIVKEYKIKICFNYEIIKSLIKIGVVYAFALFIMQLNYRIDIFLLEKLSSMKEIGYYSLGVSITEMLWQLPLAIGIVVISRSAGTNNQAALTKSVARLLRVSFLVVFIASIILFLIIPFIIPLIYGKDFIPSIQIVQTILPGILIFMIFKILSSSLAGIGKPHIIIKIFIPALIINVILNLILIPKYGGLGAALATNVSYTLGAICLLIVYSRVMKIPVIEIIKFKKNDFNFSGYIS